MLHTLASGAGPHSGAGPKSDAGPKSVSGISCRLIRFPEESDDMLLNVRLLYHNKMNLISQFTAWVHLVKWVDDTSRDRELAAWDVSMTSDQILKLFPPSSGVELARDVLTAECQEFLSRAFPKSKRIVYETRGDRVKAVYVMIVAVLESARFGALTDEEYCEVLRPVRDGFKATWDRLYDESMKRSGIDSGWQKYERNVYDLLESLLRALLSKQNVRDGITYTRETMGRDFDDD